jgi:hypothetical protein
MHLQLEVGTMWHYHESLERGSSKYSVIQ